ncbi:MAG: carboxypeptidase-like regulatory domain-containing protein [Bryobacterales bacterium]|nr:carboxypeptidase-like regulatory domain-containing protein [Bryobacterales bacterium]
MKVLFIGTAVETNDNHDGFIKSGIWYRFTVQEPFKGIETGVKEVIVDPASGTSCQERFTTGRRYLISSYGDTLAAQNAAAVTVGGFPAVRGAARPIGPVVVTGGCSGSRPVEQVAEDISFVRQYRTGSQPSRVFGFIRIHAYEWLWDDRYPPLSSAVIRITGPGGVRTTAADLNGRYEIPNVAPGTYVLTAQSAGFTSARPSYTIDVPAHGCGVANIGMFSDGSITGTVVEQDGSPARNLAVEYFHADGKIADPRFRERSMKTNEEGQFHFSKVPPGEFLVGVHIDTPPQADEGIPPTYWPGVTDVAKAQVVRLAANEKRKDLVIKLGPRVGVRTVRVRVQWPDGRPAASTDVSARVGGAIAELAKTDATGAVEFPLLNGVEYSFRGRAWTSYRIVNGNRIGDDWVDTEERTLPASSSAAEVVLLLNRPMSRR